MYVYIYIYISLSVCVYIYMDISALFSRALGGHTFGMALKPAPESEIARSMFVVWGPGFPYNFPHLLSRKPGLRRSSRRSSRRSRSPGQANASAPVLGHPGLGLRLLIILVAYLGTATGGIPIAATAAAAAAAAVISTA